MTLIQRITVVVLGFSSLTLAADVRPGATRPAAAVATQAPATSRPATQPLQPGAILSNEEIRRIDAVIAASIQAGFPDARGATIYAGPLNVKATLDPAKEPFPLPSNSSNMQMTNPGTTRVTYGFAFDGLHFKLADGSWIIACRLHFHPRPGDEVSIEKATKINPATLTADAQAKFPFDAEKQMTKWLAKEPVASRPTVIRVVNKMMPVMQLLRIDGDDFAAAAVLLHSAGWPGARELTLAIADLRARQYWQVRPWTTPDSPYDPTGEYPWAKEQEQKWHEAQTTYTLEAPDVALRRAMFRWARGQLGVFDREDAMFDAATAAAIAKSAVDPGDPQKNGGRIDEVLAGTKLPIVPPKEADLVARLQSWEARPRMPKMIVQGGGGPMSPSISTGFVAPTPAYVPQKQDLDALVALLGDERPSRFADFSGPRSVGDNAWRAVAALLEADPRKLADHPIDKPWTAQERKAAAAAVQKWWAANRGKYIEK